MIPKFRLFDKNTKEWQSIRSIGLEEDGSILYIQCWDKYEVDIDPPYFMYNLGIDFELIQSTGLRDRNGKEIFEGDIFKAPFDIGPAGFSMCKGVVEYDLEQGYQWQYLLLSELEIIGNIYENPELLENI